MKTTVIGSYPARPNPAELARSYYDPASDPYLACIERSVSAQVQAGVDIVSDGQTRDDMVNIFASKLGGTRVHGLPTIIDDIYFKSPITLDDQLFSKRLLPEGVQLKGIITGPFTMAMSCRDERYGDVATATMAFSRALNQEARAMEPEVAMIQVDEPFFSQEMPDFAREAVEAVLDGVGVETALHVCGDVSGIFGELVEIGVDVLEHEFAANPKLLDVVKGIDFRQKLGLGSVRSDRAEVEGVEDIARHIQKAVDAFGSERLLISPDCGLRHMPEDAARRKLGNMVKARDRVMADG